MKVEGPNTGRCPATYEKTAIRCRRFIGHPGPHFARLEMNDSERRLMRTVPSVSWD